MRLITYFVQAGDGGPVKIGTATSLSKRLSSLQTGNHERLAVLCAFESEGHLEAVLHAHFAAGNLRGEWFRLDTPGLCDFIAGALRDEFPDWADIHISGPPKEEEDESLPTEWCECGWPIPHELIERDETSCWSCLSEKAA